VFAFAIKRLKDDLENGRIAEAEAVIE
jgi:hypothetical protein